MHMPTRGIIHLIIMQRFKGLTAQLCEGNMLFVLVVQYTVPYLCYIKCKTNICVFVFCSTPDNHYSSMSRQNVTLNFALIQGYTLFASSLLQDKTLISITQCSHQSYMNERQTRFNLGVMHNSLYSENPEYKPTDMDTVCRMDLKPNCGSATQTKTQSVNCLRGVVAEQSSDKLVHSCEHLVTD